MENWKFEISVNKRKTVEVLHLFRWFTNTHTHTLPQEGGKIKVRTMK